MSTFVVGVDGGGTLTEAVVLGLEGQLLGRAVGRAALLDVTNTEAVAKAIHQATEAAAGEAGLTLPAAAVFAGIAGAGRPEVAASLQSALEEARVGERIKVGTDVQAAAYDALGDGPGIVLLSGTGSIAWGRSKAGRELRVGVGDDTSATKGADMRWDWRDSGPSFAPPTGAERRLRWQRRSWTQRGSTNPGT